MAMTISGYKLAAAVKQLGGIAQSKICNPVVENVILKDSPFFPGLRVMATNLSIAKAVDIRSEDPDPGYFGEVAVPIKALAAVCKQFGSKNSGNVSVHAANPTELSITKLSGTGTEFTLNGMTTEDFPPIIPVLAGETKPSIGMSCEDFRDIARRCLPSTTDERARFQLGGIQVRDAEGNEDPRFRERALWWLSTDGRRLSLVKQGPETCIFSNDREEKFSRLLPARAVKEIVSSLPKSGEVILEFDEKRAVACCATEEGQVTVATTLLENNFPPIEGILPDKGFWVMTRFWVADMVAAVSDVSVLASDKTRLVRLEADNSGVLTVTGERQETGSATALIECDGQELQVAFNANFLLEGLALLDSEYQASLFKTQDSMGAAHYLQSVRDESFTYALMPMTVKEECPVEIPEDVTEEEAVAV